MGEAENELRDLPRRIAQERVPPMAVVTRRGQKGSGHETAFPTSQKLAASALLCEGF